MGIINCTPDSFYDLSRRPGAEQAALAAGEMVSQGADILDVGGESTRPGSAYVPEEEELSRVIPVIRAIREKLTVPISVDTRKRRVAEAALDAGADIINDISAMRDDPDMVRLAADRGCPVVLMHMQGTPEDMQKNPRYRDVVDEVKSFLLEQAERAVAAGVDPSRIVLDPGIGFGKRQEDNIVLIRRIAEFREEGYPVLVGLSRKSFIGNILGTPPEERLVGSLTANGWCAARGADILRVHDVKETVQMIRILREILWTG